MNRKRDRRPDGVDKAIPRDVQTAHQDTNISTIHHAVNPNRREDFICYQIATLKDAGFSCQQVTKDLPSVCKTCGSLCGFFLVPDEVCPLSGHFGCLLRHDVRFKR